MKKYLLNAIMLSMVMTTTAAQTHRPQAVAREMVSTHSIAEATPEVEAQLLSNAPARVPRHLNSPATKASDLVGGYDCAYQWCEDIAETTDGIATVISGTKKVRIYDANDSQKSIMIAGLFDAPVSATIDFTTYDVPLIVVQNNPIATYNQYEGGGYYTRGVGYYAAQDRFYFTQIRAWVYDNEIELVDNIWIVNVKALTSGTSTLWGYVWKPGSIMTPNQQNNSVMTYHYDDFDFGAAMNITQSNYVATVSNFANVGTNPVIIRLKRGYTWTADRTILYTGNNGDYWLQGTNDDKEFFQLAGTGTLTSITSSTDWTAVVQEGDYWFGQCEPFTIRLFDEQFAYPGQTALTGDLTGDGKVDVSDVNIIVNLLLGKQVDGYVGDPDLDGSGTIDVGDVNAIINIMLGKVA